MSEDKIINLNIEGINVEIDKDLINDIMVMHGVDVVKEITNAIRKEAEKEKENGLD